MAEIPLSSQKARYRKCLEEEAINAREIRSAIARLDRRRVPFEAEDFGNRVTVIQNLGDGWVIFDTHTPQGTITCHASRLKMNGKKLIPQIELADVSPISSMGSGDPPVTMYVWAHNEGVMWLLHVPTEIEDRHPGVEMKLAFGSCGGGWRMLSRLDEKARQRAYRCLPVVSRAFSGHRVELVFQKPPREVFQEGAFGS